ncbi:MAG: nucleotidyl transferase AbiEii/AbiGii toxin family protein [Patescibacteria group bacterium]|nr:nucleotidyl transferase AbiEii/AbiGii toxin family protein [Patescibacteria group bacterium]
MLEEIFQKLVNEKREKGAPDFLIINFLKEYLQYPVLNFIYKGNDCRDFIFMGGSCLRICHGLPRISEDLDFDLGQENFKNLNLKKLAEKITKHFQNQYSLQIKTREQGGKRLYLKFPILHQLGLNFGEGSNFLYVKIEISPKQFKNSKAEIQAISGYGYNFIVKKYSLQEMMAGKIIAIFTREWFKGSKNEVDIKGRDFYDLFWYFQREVSPDFQIINKKLGIKNEKELKNELKKRIEASVTPLKLKRDLKNFLPDQKFAGDFCDNYKEIMAKYL